MTDILQDHEPFVPDLIVLFGNTNNEEGVLSDIALERCAKAALLAGEFPAAPILPTGGFGAHFNTSSRPHGELLKEELVRRGVPAQQVLPYTNSCGTVEDVLLARRVAVDRRAKSIAFVTSSFHRERVQYVCDRFFSEFVRRIDAPDNETDHPRERRTEKGKLQELKRTWVDIPLLGEAGKPGHFPSPVYQNASREQKHYDFISYLFVSGMLLSFAFPYTIDASKIGLEDVNGAAFVLSLFFIVFFYVMYLRAARLAGQARALLARIEAYFQQPGFSLNCERHPPGGVRRLLRGRPRWFWGVWSKRWDVLRGFRLMLAILALLMCAFQGFMAWWFFTHPPQPAPVDNDFAGVLSLTLNRFVAG